MVDKLLEVVKEGRPFNEEELSEFKKLSDKEKRTISKAIQKRIKDEENIEIVNEFKRVFNKLKIEEPEIARGLIKSLASKKKIEENGLNKNFKVEDVDLTDEFLLDEYLDDRSYSLNEAMIAVYRDNETPEKVKQLVYTRLYEKNQGLIIQPIKRYSVPNDGKMTMDDLAQECKYVFFDRAVSKFNLSKGVKFSTFAMTVIQNYLSSLHTNKVNKWRQEVSFDDPITDDDGTAKTRGDYQPSSMPTAEEIVMRESEMGILYEALNELNLEQKFVAYCRYGLGGVPKKTQAEIADYMHMSQANVSKIEGTMRTKLKQVLDKAGMF